jgi:predicted MFS family arabinose efflux permease
MQSPENQSLHLVHAVTAMFALLFSPDFAVYAGPYVAIIIASAVGTSWSMRRRPVTGRSKAINYFLLVIATALIITVPLSEFLADYFEYKDANLLLAPVALVVGGIGGDLPALAKWLGMRLMKVWENKFGLVDKDK